MVGNDVVLEISEAVNSTMSNSGATEPTQHLAPRPQRAERGADVPSRPSAMNTRASANRPTSAIASAASANGRSVSDGTIAAAQHIAPNTMYGVIRKMADVPSATTASFTNNLRIVR